MTGGGDAKKGGGHTLAATAAKAVGLWGKTGEGSPSGLRLCRRKAILFWNMLENSRPEN